MIINGQSSARFLKRTLSIRQRNSSNIDRLINVSKRRCSHADIDDIDTSKRSRGHHDNDDTSTEIRETKQSSSSLSSSSRRSHGVWMSGSMNAARLFDSNDNNNDDGILEFDINGRAMDGGSRGIQYQHITLVRQSSVFSFSASIPFIGQHWYMGVMINPTHDTDNDSNGNNGDAANDNDDTGTSIKVPIRVEPTIIKKGQHPLVFYQLQISTHHQLDQLLSQV
jgi:hypothetical protein